MEQLLKVAVRAPGAEPTKETQDLETWNSVRRQRRIRREPWAAQTPLRRASTAGPRAECSRGSKTRRYQRRQSPRGEFAQSLNVLFNHVQAVGRQTALTQSTLEGEEVQPCELGTGDLSDASARIKGTCQFQAQLLLGKTCGA